jgi:hypothetical protein
MIAILAGSLIFSFNMMVYGQILWKSDLNSAIKEAEQKRKPLFLYFFTDKSKECQMYQQETFNHPEIVKMLNAEYVSASISTDKNQTVAVKYGVFRSPTIVITDSSGREFQRILSFYKPADLLVSLKETPSEITGQPAQAPDKTLDQIPSMTTIFHEPFDNLYGWQNELSSEGCLVRISLVPGVSDKAFKINYELKKEGWSYVQIRKNLKESQKIVLPREYTMIFHAAGSGGKNSLAIKMVDSDGTNFGYMFPIPLEEKGQKFVVTSDQIGYLWGGQDKVLNKFEILFIAIAPIPEEWEKVKDKTSGVVYIDELVIVPYLIKNNPYRD